ncbi:hypothetical protein IEQ34_004244 [Dendrobium chrysotoxum]|uniref:Uncharacterized protein n=1 Tax=Dendrobium chrysotoxum TaxID=161865 RepID=A0AAV7HDJ3_DENCH|nr:hypothetical protein IEQ34_004244 [Dendrobium chrysotoxum]
MRDLPAPLHVGEEDIMRLLKVPDVKHLLYEVHYLNKYIKEEFMFKVGLSFQAGRSDARMLKSTSKVPEPPALAPKEAPKRYAGGEDPQSLNEWNAEFIKVKYLQGEYKQRYDLKTKEAKVLEEELCGCRTELANIIHFVSLQDQQIDRLQVDLERAQTTIIQLCKDQKASIEKVAVLEAENKRSQTLITEKEAALTGFESLRDRDRIYEVEVKALEQQCIDEGFLKGVHLVQRKIGVKVEGLTPSQASDDSPPDSDGDEIESEL